MSIVAQQRFAGGYYFPTSRAMALSFPQFSFIQGRHRFAFPICCSAAKSVTNGYDILDELHTNSLSEPERFYVLELVQRTLMTVTFTSIYYQYLASEGKVRLNLIPNRDQQPFSPYKIKTLSSDESRENYQLETSVCLDASENSHK